MRVARFDPNRRGYDPELRPYRVTTYVVFIGGILWLCGSMLYSLIDYFVLR